MSPNPPSGFTRRPLAPGKHEQALGVTDVNFIWNQLAKQSMQACIISPHAYLRGS